MFPFVSKWLHFEKKRLKSKMPLHCGHFSSRCFFKQSTYWLVRRSRTSSHYWMSDKNICRMKPSKTMAKSCTSRLELADSRRRDHQCRQSSMPWLWQMTSGDEGVPWSWTWPFQALHSIHNRAQSSKSQKVPLLEVKRVQRYLDARILQMHNYLTLHGVSKTILLHFCKMNRAHSCLLRIRTAWR